MTRCSYIVRRCYWRAISRLRSRPDYRDRDRRTDSMHKTSSDGGGGGGADVRSICSNMLARRTRCGSARLSSKSNLLISESPPESLMRGVQRRRRRRSAKPNRIILRFFLTPAGRPVGRPAALEGPPMRVVVSLRSCRLPILQLFSSRCFSRAVSMLCPLEKTPPKWIQSKRSTNHNTT